MVILKWKFETIIDQTQISTIQDHSKLIYLSHNSLFLPLRSSQNINVCTGPPCRFISTRNIIKKRCKTVGLTYFEGICTSFMFSQSPTMTYTQHVLIRNSLIRNTSEILGFLKKSLVDLSKFRNNEITSLILKKHYSSEKFQNKKH